MKKIAVLFSGAGTTLAYLLEHLHRQNGIEIVVALTNRPNAEGIAFAKAYDIPLEVIDSTGFAKREDFDGEVVERLRGYEADLTVLAGFMRILTPVFTDNIRSINLHPSLLPRHKGLNAIEKSYHDTHPNGGVTVHYVTSQLDGGEIILQATIPKEGLSFEIYEACVRKREKELLVEAIAQLLLFEPIL